jgi:hypothetical protein
VILVLFFDIGHVYGSLYRSYFNLEEFKKRRSLYILVPIFATLIGATLVWFDPTVRTLLVLLAWIAVWHFIRQQVGFTLLYGSRDQYISKAEAHVSRRFDILIIWSVTGFPLLYWWTRQSSMNFSWFVENEFPHLPPEIFPSLWNIFWIIITLYCCYQLFVNIFLKKWVNPWKYWYILGTAFIWFNGIVWHNSPLIFGLGNVMLHGLNYYGIVYLSTKNKSDNKDYPTWKWMKYLIGKGFLTMSVILFAFAYVEEFFWNELVWKEHVWLYGSFLSHYVEHVPAFTFAIMVGFLAMPQLTHYILDGFIWKKDSGTGIR